jgi:hypothetical protein
MKNAFLTLLCVCSAVSLLHAQKQPAQNIRFVFGGDEDKPHGTIIISVDRYIKPIDRGRLDAIFGRCIVTNKQTFDSVKQFIRANRLPTPTMDGISDTVLRWGRRGYGYYSILGSDGTVFYLCEQYWPSFFGDLKSKLRNDALDKRVVAAL